MVLIKKLKDKRKEIADREGKQLFMIFPNATLEETAKVQPKTKEDLIKIKGWGKKKIAQYGDEVLEILNNSEDIEKDNDKNNSKESLWQESLKEKVFAVSEFIDFINQVVGGLGQVKIRGEISGVQNRSGNVYFTLKDSAGGECVVNCFVWRWEAERFSHLLEDGLEVIIKGISGIYKNGRFSITVKSIEPVGEGALQKAFEALKKKLEARGYFDEARKRPIPEFVKRIALVTSNEGEAINDFRKNIGEYGFSINLLDVRVEGDSAEESISKAISWFNKNHPEMDALVLIRGGGSLESLKAFNGERVIEAIISSRIPVITGIGHEKNETIADYVADKRCSTPTAVAVFLRSQRESLILKIDNIMRDLDYSLSLAIDSFREKTSRVSERLELIFRKFLDNKKYNIIRLGEKLNNGMQEIFRKFRRIETEFLKRVYESEKEFERMREKAKNIENILEQSFLKNFEHFIRATDTAEKILLQLNPRTILGRGYSVVYNQEGKVIKDSNDAKMGDLIKIMLHKGDIESIIKKIKND